jgi:Flp pilus assembly protein TadB
VLIGVLVVVVLAAIALAIAFNWWRHEYNDVVNVNH